MKLEFTFHALDRCLERTGLTGVQMTNLINKKVKRKHLIYTKPTHVWIKGFGIRLTMIRNLIITIWKQ